jgi:8-oxo-dGTP diphosphatase
MPDEDSGVLRVAAGVLVEDGHVLIAQRHSERTEGGEWEFPGGKLEPGETPEACLVRELEEELGIQTRVLGPLLTTTHTYPWGTIELIALRVERLAGVPMPHDHADLRWVVPAELPHYEFAAADHAIVHAVRALMGAGA